MSTRIMTDQVIRGYYTRATSEGDLVFTAVTSGVKRDGLAIDLAGMSTDNFMRNPVVLWVHDYWGNRPPIGRVTSLTKGDSAFDTTIRFDPDDDFAQEIERKYRDGYLSAISVGWDTIESSGSVITRSDLLDISAVPVPGDQDALMKRAETYARTLLRSRSSDSPGVSDEPPSDRPLNRVADAEQLDRIIAMLQEMRDTMVETTEDPTAIASADDVFGPGLLTELQTLLGESE